MRLPLFLLPCVLFATAACGEKSAGDDGEISIDIRSDSKAGGAASAADTADPAGEDVAGAGGKGSGEVSIDLPGGFGGKIRVPADIMADARVDIDGVKLYPGSRVRSVKVRARSKGGSDDGSVRVGFVAPADAAAVADWYQQQLAAKKVAATRTGETLTGTTSDGDRFTLAMTPAESGSAGMLTIVDVSK